MRDSSEKSSWGRRCPCLRWGDTYRGVGVGAPVDGLATTILEAYPVRQDWEYDPAKSGLILSRSVQAGT